MIDDETIRLTRAPGEYIDIDIKPTGTSPYVVTTASLFASTDPHADDSPLLVGDTGGGEGEASLPMSITVRMRSTDMAEAYTDFEALRAFMHAASQDIWFEWAKYGLERMRFVRRRGAPGSDEAMNENFRMTLKFRALFPFDFGPLQTVPVAKNTTVDVLGGGFELSPAWSCVIGPCVNPVIQYTSAEGLITLGFPVTVPSGWTFEVNRRGPEGYPVARLVDPAGVPGTSNPGRGIKDLSNGARVFGFDCDSGGGTGATFSYRNCI